jgi:hypothetical protein
MKKFEIIEEGRLSNSEMGEIVGGDLVCSKTYWTCEECDFGQGPVVRASCPGIYMSCEVGGGLTSCAVPVDGYVGEPGPAGEWASFDLESIESPESES